jgi:hypothetical protein
MLEVAMHRCVVVLAACGLAAAAQGQSRFIVADRDTNSLFAIDDANGNGLIDEPGEVLLAFSAANAAGTLSIETPTTLAVRSDGVTAMGDQVNRNVYMFRDWNRDGDFQDVGESGVVADAANLSAVSFAFPTGAAFDPASVLYIVNAGNAFGNDGVYRLADLTGDGDFQDAGEVTTFIGSAFLGPGNGPYSPQEVLFTPAAVLTGYLRNSSANLHGIYRFVDADLNGNCDNAAEVTLFWGAGNAAGITPSAGFAIEFDAFRPGALYLLQTATGSLDQLIRVHDLDGDGDAQEADESVIVFSTAEAGFTNVDVVSLTSGQVLITDNSGKRIIVLTDTDNDGLFSAGERATYFANTSLLVGDVRQASPINRVCRSNCDDSAGTPLLTANDFACFLNAYATESLYANCDSSSGSPILTANDFACFLNAFAAGCN